MRALPTPGAPPHRGFINRGLYGVRIGPACCFPASAPSPEITVFKAALASSGEGGRVTRNPGRLPQALRLHRGPSGNKVGRASLPLFFSVILQKIIAEPTSGLPAFSMIRGLCEVEGAMSLDIVQGLKCPTGVFPSKRI